MLPDMERTLVRVALFCCWLDCDSSLAGASLVIRVCRDGSDLQQATKLEHGLQKIKQRGKKAAFE